jgi:hypothetical protein
VEAVRSLGDDPRGRPGQSTKGTGHCWLIEKT